MSASQDIDVLQGNFTEDFFKKDFHANNTVSSIFKSKSSVGGALKFTWVSPLYTPSNRVEREAVLLLHR